MNTTKALHLALRWLLAPIAVGLVSASLSARVSAWLTPAFFDAPPRATQDALTALEGEVHLSIADATWTLGDEATAQRVLRSELDRIYGTEGPAVAQLYIRAALLDPSPDGRRALTNYACVADAKTCADIPASFQHQTELRWVAGPDLPPGHPAL